MTVRELITAEDEEFKSELRGYETQLNEMTLAFQQAILELDNSTSNLDQEIRSFNILDDFFNDPDGMNRIDTYLNILYETINGSELNSVTSSIALSALGILETLKEIKLENPGFNLQLEQLQAYMETIQAENTGLQTEILALEAETQLSGDVRMLSENVYGEHEALQKKLAKYRKTEILRNPYVTRTLDTCLSLGLADTVGVSLIREQEQAVRNLMDFALECLQDKFP
jgi:hypothetical protein